MLSIRQMKVEDLEDLSRVYVDAFKDPELGENWEPKSAYALLEDWFKRQPDLSFVAEYNNKLVGAFVVGVRPWWDGYHLVDGELFIASEYQKQGIGSRLIKEVLEEANKKYSPLTWETYTFRNQEFPLNWYKSIGFKEIEEWVMIKADISQILEKL